MALSTASLDELDSFVLERGEYAGQEAWLKAKGAYAMKSMLQFKGMPGGDSRGVNYGHLIGWQLYAQYLRSLASDLVAENRELEGERDALRQQLNTALVQPVLEDAGTQTCDAQPPKLEIVRNRTIQCNNCQRHGHVSRDCVSAGGGREGQTWINRKKAYRLPDGSLEYKYKKKAM